LLTAIIIRFAVFTRPPVPQPGEYVEPLSVKFVESTTVTPHHPFSAVKLPIGFIAATVIVKLLAGAAPPRWFPKIVTVSPTAYPDPAAFVDTV